MKTLWLLLRKELRLSLHPTAPLFLLLSAMLLIPNYPYLVVFFYTTLAIFFTCLTGRENQDVTYTLLLPVSKRDVVRARFLLITLMEAAQLLSAVPFALLRQHLSPAPNLVGMDANAALFGLALLMLGVFNLCFFRIYYRNVTQVGKAFLFGSMAVAIFIVLTEVSVHTVPFVRDVLDAPVPLHLLEKHIALLLGLLLWLLLTFAAYRHALCSFEKQDV